MNTLNGHGKRRKPDPEPIAPPEPDHGAPGCKRDRRESYGSLV